MFDWQALNALKQCGYPHWQLVQFVKQNRIFFGNKVQCKKYEEYRLPISFKSVILPTVLTLVFGIRSLLVLIFGAHLNSAKLRLMLYAEFLFPNVRDIFELTFVITSAMHLAIVWYVLRKPVQQYKLFAVLACEIDGDIHPKELGLCSLTFLSLNFNFLNWIFHRNKSKRILFFTKSTKAVESTL